MRIDLFPVFSKVGRLALFLWVVLPAFFAPPPANASALINSSVELQSLSVTPSSGTAILDLTASSVSVLSNSLGEQGGWDISGQPNIWQHQSITWGNVSGLADNRLPTFEVLADNLIPPGTMGGSVLASVQQTFVGTLTITGSDGPVDVQFDAMVHFLQSAATDSFGLARSQERFSMSLEDDSLLSYDLDNTVGHGTVFLAQGTDTVDTSLTLMTNHAYHFVFDAEIVSESSNSTSTPEPATLWLLLGGVAPAVFRRFYSAGK